MFQSPSLRGSGRFGGARRDRSWSQSSFNPLHCGAVVASCLLRWRCILGRLFQSPSLRGSGRFWLLSSSFPQLPFGFNPLHCGAVVASNKKAKTDKETESFNPLHCGAVVASYEA